MVRAGYTQNGKNLVEPGAHSEPHKHQPKENIMFEKASRLNIRFDTVKGMLTVEDLWVLPLISNTGKANLDDIARNLHKQLKNDDDVSFVNVDRKSDTSVQLKFDIVKHIIEVRLAENAVAEQARSNKESKEKILRIIAERQDENLKNMPLEDLKQMVNELK